MVLAAQWVYRDWLISGRGKWVLTTINVYYLRSKTKQNKCKISMKLLFVKSTNAKIPRLFVQSERGNKHAELLARVKLHISIFILKRRREWDSNPCGPEGPRALKARALTTLPSRHYKSTLLIHCVLNVYRILDGELTWISFLGKVLNLQAQPLFICHPR